MTTEEDRETDDPSPGVRTSPVGKALYAVVGLLTSENGRLVAGLSPALVGRAAEECATAGYGSCAAQLRAALVSATQADSTD